MKLSSLNASCLIRKGGDWHHPSASAQCGTVKSWEMPTFTLLRCRTHLGVHQEE